jgi:hypothetical protein
MVKGTLMKTLDDVRIRVRQEKTLDMVNWLRVTHKKHMR